MRSAALIFIMFISAFAFAQTAPSPEEVESRARQVGDALRCVVCQNQSIEESEATLAKDMRVIVRERIAAGESDAQVIEFMRSRYGDYVLLRPPLQGNTYLLWFLPAFIVLAMAFWFLLVARKRKVTGFSAKALSDEEQDILKRLMDDNE